jgi:hypothetical protein
MFTSRDAVFVGYAIAHEHRFATFAVRCRCFGGWLTLGSRNGRTRRQAANLKSNKRLVYFHDVAHVAVQLGDRAFVRTRQFHGGFGSFNVHEWLVQRDRVTDVDLPGNDLGLDETFPDVREQEDLFAQLS